jgi:mannose-1-phosphate guanylyltransferase
LINAGVYLLEPSVLDAIPTGRRVSIERETFPALAADGVLFAWPTDAYWLDTGTPASYLLANTDVLSGVDSLLTIDTANGSWCHPQATVHPSATLLRAVVDRGCVVGPGAHVEDAVLLPGAVVQENARVRSSIVGPHAVIGAHSDLGPICVVGANEHVAPESQLSGDVRLGGV